MTLEKIIEIADKAYGDGLVDMCAADDTQIGDTLALFIARELKESYDPERTDAEQLYEARVALRTAFDELGEVLNAFDTAAAQALEKEDPCQE